MLFGTGAEKQVRDSKEESFRFSINSTKWQSRIYFRVSQWIRETADWIWEDYGRLQEKFGTDRTFARNDGRGITKKNQMSFVARIRCQFWDLGNKCRFNMSVIYHLMDLICKKMLKSI